MVSEPVQAYFSENPGYDIKRIIYNLFFSFLAQTTMNISLFFSNELPNIASSTCSI